ncbi:MAG: PAS domain-containing protein [Desulfovibrionaceae bacterium]|nr:PAS domain-containing protein [Desulfovibrionaceae bacterium]
MDRAESEQNSKNKQHSDVIQRSYQRVIDELNAAVFEWDLKTNRFYYSEAYKKYALSRVDEKDILNNTGPLDTIHPDDVPILQNFFKETGQGKERVEAVLRLKCIDGSFRWCRMIGFFYRDEQGAPSRTVGIIIDINEEQERLCVLEASRKREQALLASIPGGVAIYRLKKNGVVATDYVSEGLAKLCGYSFEEFSAYLKPNAMINVVPEDIPRVMEAAQNSLQHHQPVNIYYRIHTKSGADILTRLDANLIEDCTLGEDDIAVWYAVHTTVSESTKLALMEQEHYRMILNITGTAYFEWDRNKSFYASDSFSKYAVSAGGYNAIMGRAKGSDSIYPEDIPKLRKYMQRAQFLNLCDS